MVNMEDMERTDYIFEELTESGEKSGIQREINDDVPQEPFDPKEILIRSKVISLDTIIRRIKSNTIRLSPDFQRKLVWDKKRKSLLIESLVLKIPVAMFYISEDSRGNWDVVDGLQRLTTIKEFIIDKSFALENLEFWNTYNGAKIDDLPPLPYNNIMETEFNFVIIEPGTPESVKYNIFKRINTGGLPLSNQEIRHALFQGKGTELLARLSESESFLIATDKSINDSRMGAREIILRCLSFLILGQNGYSKNDNMESFLRKGIQVLNNLGNLPNSKLEKEYGEEVFLTLRNIGVEELIRLFDLGMKRNVELFQKNAFRISLQDQSRSPVNKSLFETWGSLLALLSEEDFLDVIKNQKVLLSEYDKKKKEPLFYRAVSRDAWKKDNVDYRFTEISKIIQGAIND
jgi:hypothetical protein